MRRRLSHCPYAAVLAIACAALLLACDDNDGSGTLIGATCDDSAQCGPAGVCVTSGKDGLCTLPCTTSGWVGECPLNTLCDRQNVATDTDPKGEITLCFPACESNDDCRGGYKCGGVSDGPGKVCHPK